MAAVLEIAAPPLLLLPPPRRPVAVPPLPDVLHPDLDIVFAGTAAGRRSAEAGAYYAHPGNCFWPTLWSVGLTPSRFSPSDFVKLPEVGIGFTDISKSSVGMDCEVRISAEEVAAFDARMRHYRPRAIAFTGKKAASLWLRRRTASIGYGRQPKRRDAFCEVFVLTSPSSAARLYWKIDPWHQLADWLRATQPWRF